MKTLQERFDDIKYVHPTIKNQFVSLVLFELTNSDFKSNDISQLEKRFQFLKRFTPIYFDILNQKFDSIENIESVYNEFSIYSFDFELYLKTIFTNSFEKLDKLAISWEYELDIPPVVRYLIIQDRVPLNFISQSMLSQDKYKVSEKKMAELQYEFQSFLKEKHNKNLVSVGVSYSYGNVVLPKTYEIIFDIEDRTRFWEQKSIVRFAFNYGTFFHTDLWRGHHSHCLIEIVGDVPEIFNELPQNGGEMTLHTGIGLCTKYDWQFIKEIKFQY